MKKELRERLNFYKVETEAGFIDLMANKFMAIELYVEKSCGECGQKDAVLASLEQIKLAIQIRRMEMKSERKGARKKKLEALKTHAWYSKQLKKFTKFELEEINRFIEEHGEKPKPAWAAMAVRMHLEGYGYPKTPNWNGVSEVLIAIK